MSDYYSVLGVSRDATADQIKKSYRDLAFKYHPDRNADTPNSEEMFKKISEAYTILGDPEKKTRYDMGGYTTDQPFSDDSGYSDPRYQSGYGNPFGNYSWTFYSPFGFSREQQKQEKTEYTKEELLGYLLRNILTAIAGVFLFRYSLWFGIFGLIVCVAMIGKGVINSLKAVRLLFSLKH